MFVIWKFGIWKIHIRNLPLNQWELEYSEQNLCLLEDKAPVGRRRPRLNNRINLIWKLNITNILSNNFWQIYNKIIYLNIER